LNAPPLQEERKSILDADDQLGGHGPGGDRAISERFLSPTDQNKRRSTSSANSSAQTAMSNSACRTDHRSCCSAGYVHHTRRFPDVYSNA